MTAVSRTFMRLNRDRRELGVSWIEVQELDLKQIKAEARFRSRNWISKLGVSAVFCIDFCLAGAQVVQGANGYQFRAKYVKHRSASYVVQSNADILGSKMIMTMHLSEKVLAVTGRVGTIEIRTGKTDITINGKPFGNSTAVDNKMGTFKLDELGTSTDGSGASLQTHIELPPQVVKIGSSWTTKGVAMLPGQAQEQQVSVTYRFVGFDQLSGVRVVKLAVKMSGSGVAGASGSGYAWIRADDCSLVKESETLTITAQQMKIPATIQVIRK